MSWNRADQPERAIVVELLGCSQLIGQMASFQWLANVREKEIAALATETLPHRAGAEKIDEWQLQLWLGLRSIASIKKSPIPLPLAAIDQTLQLWRANLLATSDRPSSIEHNVNMSMIRWLEKCSRSHQACLLPDDEPLWLASGLSTGLR